MKTYQNNLLRIELTEDDSTLSLVWLGKSADREPGVFLLPILTQALATGETGKRLVLDFCQLEFMNSSTFTPISKILEAAKKGTAQLQIIYRKSVNWQELSFSALRIFETKDQRIAITGR